LLTSFVKVYVNQLKQIDMKNLLNKFNSLNGAKMIGITNYYAKTSGEIANHNICVNVSVLNAKRSDLKALQNVDDAKLIAIADASKIALDVLRISLAEMVESATKNLSENADDRTAQSNGQSNAYLNIGKGIRLHLETMTVHVFGKAVKKTVIVSGTYKTVNSSAKTLGKKAITKALNLKAGKFRDFILGNADNLRISGTTIEIVNNAFGSAVGTV